MEQRVICSSCRRLVPPARRARGHPLATTATLREVGAKAFVTLSRAAALIAAQGAHYVHVQNRCALFCVRTRAFACAGWPSGRRRPLTMCCCCWCGGGRREPAAHGLQLEDPGLIVRMGGALRRGWADEPLLPLVVLDLQ